MASSTVWAVVGKSLPIASPEEMNQPGMRIGVPQGAASMSVGERLFTNATFAYYASAADACAAVQYHKIDGLLFDRHMLEYAAHSNPELAVLPQDIAEEHIAVGFPKKHTALRDEVNAFIRQYRSDGTYDEMWSRWFFGAHPVMPSIPDPIAPTRTLRVGTEGLAVPMNYVGPDGKLTGMDIEFVRRLALFLNAKLEVTAMNFDGLIPSIQSGRIDMLIASLNITDERKENMIFSDDYLDSSIAMLIRADRLGVAARERDVGHGQSAGGEAPGPIQSVVDLKGKRAASLTGGAFQQLTEPLVSGVDYRFFNDVSTSVQALISGKVDAVLLDEPMSRMWAARRPDDVYLATVYAEDHYSSALRKGSPLLAAANESIRRMRESGELARFKAKWCDSADPDRRLEVWTDNPDFDGSAGEFRYGTDPTQEPMSFQTADGSPAGMDLEVMNRVAYDLNMTFVPVYMNFGALIEALQAGRVECVGASMSVTAERKKMVDFVDSYYEGGLSILARRTPREKKAPPPPAFTTLESLNNPDVRIGVMTGTTSDFLAAEKIPLAQHVHFANFSDGALALSTGKIDAFPMEEPNARVMLRETSGLRVLGEKMTSDDYAFIFPKKKQPLCDAISEQIRAMKSDGTLARLAQKWFELPADRQHPESPDAALTNGTLKFATVPQLEPFVFLRDGQVVGYDIDVARLAAAALGRSLEIIPMEFSALIEAVASGRADFAGCGITITEERKNSVAFSEPDYSGGIVMIVRGDALPGAETAAPASGPWYRRAIHSFAESCRRTFVREQRWKLILDGLQVTLVITIFAAILGTLLAFPVCMLRRSSTPFLQSLGKGYIALMQGTPTLIVLMILYYVLFADVNIEAVPVAILGFALNFAAYAGEMLRTGIDGVPRGQSEAARALGFSRFAVFRKVVLPQALRSILPVYRGEFINMLKMTSIVGYIAIQDLTKVSDIIRSRTYEAFFPLIATALIYFLIAHLLASILTYTEFRLDPTRRRNRLLCRQQQRTRQKGAN